MGRRLALCWALRRRCVTLLGRVTDLRRGNSFGSFVVQRFTALGSCADRRQRRVPAKAWSRFGPGPVGLSRPQSQRLSSQAASSYWMNAEGWMMPEGRHSLALRHLLRRSSNSVRLSKTFLNAFVSDAFGSFESNAGLSNPGMAQEKLPAHGERQVPVRKESRRR